MLENKNIAFIANTDWYLANFRFDLACALDGPRTRAGSIDFLPQSAQFAAASNWENRLTSGYA